MLKLKPVLSEGVTYLFLMSLEISLLFIRFLPPSRASSRGENSTDGNSLAYEFSKHVTLFFIMVWDAFVIILYPNGRCVLINSRYNVITHSVP